jgi:uncharacterized protein (TIGR03086 family)
VSPALDDAVELLERALGYTRVALADVTDEALGNRTPCAGWRLGRLLAHMEDALDAFIEAASGTVRVDPPRPTETRVDALREKACTLLGAWARAAPAEVQVAGVGLDSSVLVGTAALEITVHGWDVGQATGRGAAIPEDLARRLLEVAQEVVDDTDRRTRFRRSRPVSADATHEARLLAYLGRHLTGPPGQIPHDSDVSRRRSS